MEKQNRRNIYILYEGDFPWKRTLIFATTSEKQLACQVKKMIRSGRVHCCYSHWSKDVQIAEFNMYYGLYGIKEAVSKCFLCHLEVMENGIERIA